MKRVCMKCKKSVSTYYLTQKGVVCPKCKPKRKP